MNRTAPEVGKTIRAMMVPNIRSIDEKERTIDFIASDETVDRYGDIIRVRGWDTSNYVKNPVFLFGHRSQDPPVGQTVKIWTEKGDNGNQMFLQRVKFPDAKTYPFAATLFNLYKGGYMRAVSVGFRPLEKPTPIKDADGKETGGYEFTKQELLELSAVSIPANPSAVARGFEEAETAGALTLDREIRCALFGEKNPPWSNSVPGATFPDGDDEPAQKSAAIDAAIESVIAAPKKSESAETAAKVEEIRSSVSRLSSELRSISDSSAGREEVALLESRMQEVLSRLDKLAAAAAKDSVLSEALGRIDQLRTSVDKAAQASAKEAAVSEAMSRVEEIRSRVDKVLLNSAKKADLSDIVSKLDSLRSALDSLAKEATTEHLVDSLAELREIISRFSSDVATKADINGLVEKIENGCKRLDGIEAMIREGFSTVQREATAQKLELDRSVCPYTDDPIAAKDTKWDASKEMGKQSKPAGWKHMSTVIVGDPANKTSYKLPHHEGTGFKVVPEGVRAALGRLEATQMPAADRAGARAHLTKHQQKISEAAGFHFDADDFSSKLDALGRSYRSALEEGDMDAAKSIDRLIQRHIDSAFPEETRQTETQEQSGPIESLEDLAKAIAKDSSDDDPGSSDDTDSMGCPDCNHDVAHDSGPDMNQCTAEGCDCASGFMPKSE